jgi:hypothetical protein
MPAAALEIRLTIKISLFNNESGISKKYLSSILCTLKRPSSVFALSVITSLYGLGPRVVAPIPGVLRVESLGVVGGCAMADVQTNTIRTSMVNRFKKELMQTVLEFKMAQDTESSHSVIILEGFCISG